MEIDQMKEFLFFIIEKIIGYLMIKKTKEGYKVTSEKGKNLGGPYKTKKEAINRLKEVEYFKHKKGQ